MTKSKGSWGNQRPLPTAKVTRNGVERENNKNRRVHHYRSEEPAEAQRSNSSGGDENNIWANFSMAMQLAISQSRNKDQVKKEAERQSSKCIQLPAFWRTSPSTWFICIKSKYNIDGITDNDLKFNYVFANLSLNW